MKMPVTVARLVGLGMGLLLAACGGSTPGGPLPADASLGDGNPFAFLDLGGDAPLPDAPGPTPDATTEPDGGRPPPACVAATQFVYLLTQEEELVRFDPPTLAFTTIGRLDCPVSGSNPNDPFGSPPTPFSMAVNRQAVAFVEYNDGSLFQVDTQTAACQRTDFRRLSGETFGMGFSSNGPGSEEETLFASLASADGSCTRSRLGQIAIPGFGLSEIGAYDDLFTCAELTGSGAGELFGAFQGNPFVVAQIDKSSGHIISMMPTDVQVDAFQYNFAFATYGGDFWLFVGPGTSTEVFQVSTASGSTTRRTETNHVIVGAGVSTCAPYRPQG